MSNDALEENFNFLNYLNNGIIFLVLSKLMGGGNPVT